MKRRYDAPPGLFEAEAAGLAWLRVPGGVPVVEVLAVQPQSITLARLTPVTPTPAAADEFGARLAVTHAAGAPAFGSPPPTLTGPAYIADLPMTTTPTGTWGEFYATQRVLPYARQAGTTLGQDGLKIMEALATRLMDGHFDDDTKPARLHGDLWSGNVIFTRSGATLIDPSAGGGHPITDLAMLALFGAPNLTRILQAYESNAPALPESWRDLIPLHQVYPLLVHTVLFGPSYAATAKSAARKYL